MVTKVVFLFALFAVASSELPQQRRCDPEPQKEKPTHCSNYRNIEYLAVAQTKLEKKQNKLEQRISDMEHKTGLHLEQADSDIIALKILATNLSSALKNLETTKLQTEMELKDTKTQLDKHKADILNLKREVQDLVKHGKIVGGNFSEIKQKLHATEQQLRDKKAKLESLESETEAAFNDTQRLMNSYKNELFSLNKTAQELEVKVKAQLGTTKTELEARLEKIQKKSEGFSAKLSKQKADTDKFKEETGNKFNNVDNQLKTQRATVDKQKVALNTLKSDTAGINTRLRTAEQKLLEQNNLTKEVTKIAAQASAKVAFSATVVEGPGVFTGPVINNNLLIFNKVFMNVGNAYNKKTGIFTAPVKGAYYFSFMTFGYNSYTSGAILVKNGHYQVSTWEFKGPDVSDTTSNSVILELCVGETVNIILWKGGKIHTSVFSGFLIFPTK